MDDGPKAPDLKIIMVLAFTLALGLLCNILACIIWSNWWPIITVIFYFFAPIPDLMCSTCGRNHSDMFNPSSQRNFKDMGYFLTGLLVVSGFALPAVLAHADVINVGALFLAIAGGLIVYASIIVYIHFFHAKPKDDLGF